MPKKSMLMREIKRIKMIKKYRNRREQLKQLRKSSNDYETTMDVQTKISKLPRNSNPVRHNTRCQQCGRAHAVYRKFCLCRICLRKQLMAGNIPGGRMSSW